MSVELLDGMTPLDLGLDEFSSYRTDPFGHEVQLEAIEFLAYAGKRFAAGCIPTGIGKSLIAVSLQKLLQMRACTLSATLGVQEQYKRFEKYGLVDVRGRSNFECADYPNLDCKGGATMNCAYVKGHGCGYETVRDQARVSNLVSANYAYWMTVNDKAGGIQKQGEQAEIEGGNPFEMLILDEADQAPELLSNYLAMTFTEKEVGRWVDPKMLGDSIKEWQGWIRECGVVEELDEELRTSGMELAHLGRDASREMVGFHHALERKAEKFKRVNGIEDDWVCEANLGTRFGRTWKFEVVWPGRYAEQFLFRGIPKIVLMSATLKPKTMAMLGIKREEYEFKEWRRIFALSNCPVYYYPPEIEDDGKTKVVRITQKTLDRELKVWVEYIDSILETRLDRRIILMTSSYKYQEFLINNSRFGKYMDGNRQDPDSETAAEMFEKFIISAPPKILCSPSFGRGWDFKYDRAEVAIISKVPLRVPGGASKVMAARLERDKEYGDSETMRDVVQMCGRLQREEDDKGEVFIVDGSWSWFARKNKHLAPLDFVDNVRRLGSIPARPPKISLA